MDRALSKVNARESDEYEFPEAEGWCSDEEQECYEDLDDMTFDEYLRFKNQFRADDAALTASLRSSSTTAVASVGASSSSSSSSAAGSSSSISAAVAAPSAGSATASASASPSGTPPGYGPAGIEVRPPVPELTAEDIQECAWNGANLPADELNGE